MSRSITLACTLLAIICTGCMCGESGLTEQRTRWEKAEPEAYQYTLRIICFCTTNVTGAVRVEVRNGQPVSVIRIEDDEPADATLFNRYDTIDKLFDLLDDAYEQRAHRVNVEYDMHYGFPADVFIDYIEFAADDELSFVVTEFEALDE